MLVGYMADRPNKRVRHTRREGGVDIKEIVRVLSDDLGDGRADQTVRFGLDGVLYEIDLSDENANMLRRVLAPYLLAGRRVGKAGRPACRSLSRQNENRRIREWLNENGYQVGWNGRIPASLVEMYRQAHDLPATVPLHLP